MNITPTHSPAPKYPALAAMAVVAALSLSSCPEQRRDAQPLAGAPLPPRAADTGAKPLPRPGDTLKPEELPPGTAFAGRTADGNTLYLTPDDSLITLRADGNVVDVATQVIAGEAPPAQGKQSLGGEYMPPRMPMKISPANSPAPKYPALAAVAVAAALSLPSCQQVQEVRELFRTSGLPPAVKDSAPPHCDEQQLPGWILPPNEQP